MATAARWQPCSIVTAVGFVAWRIEAPGGARLDASDVFEEASLDVTRCLDAYLTPPIAAARMARSLPSRRRRPRDEWSIVPSQYDCEDVV